MTSEEIIIQELSANQASWEEEISSLDPDNISEFCDEIERISNEMDSLRAGITEYLKE